MRAWTWMSWVLVLAAIGCGGSDGGGGQGGAGGPIGGALATGGMMAVTGGTTAGTIAGMGTGGTGAPATTPGCDVYAAMAVGTARGTHDTVAAMLRGDGTPMNTMGSCAFSSCHNMTAKAMLNLTADPDITKALVDVPACEAQGMVRVKAGDPLTSWLWIKLTGPADSSGNITFAGTPQNCAGATPGTLGILMPWSPGSPASLQPTQLFQICSWIEDGAPGPGM